MAKAGDNVPRIVCANTIQQNEKRLLDARIKNQGKDRVKRDLNKLFNKLNQAVKVSMLKTLEHLSQSCYSRRVTSGSYGPVPGFPPGSWWGIRMDCSRDRVHEPFDADVHEGPFGVISICTSSTNVNEDVDLGDSLTFTGRMYHEGGTNVDPFVCNHKNQIPLRLIRSYNLQDDIAPNTGYRYDGLYVVIGSWIGSAADGARYNKFALMRLTDQESPSFSSQATASLASAQRCVPFSVSSISPNTYTLRQCSLGVGGKRKYSQRDDRTSLPVQTLRTVSLIDTGKKSVPESSIVMRHVSKKPPSNAENAISTSVPERKTLTCLGASAAKTHSTNISIRMGLYESSHSAQDAKKIMSTMLHKPIKPLDLANRMLLDMEVARVPLKEDSKLPARIDASDKTVKPSNLSENVSCNGHVVADNANDVGCPSLSKRRRNLCSMVEQSPEYPQPASPALLITLDSGSSNATDCPGKIPDAQSCLNEHRLNSADESTRKLDPTNESAQKLNPFTKPEIQKLHPADESSSDSITAQDERLHGRFHDAAEMPGEPLCAQNMKSLDSLTPDKILNLINKEKHHPLSKMLIGNVIGLTVEECAMLNAKTKVTTASETKTRASPRMNLKKRDNAKENVAVDNGKYRGKYPRSKRLTWKVASRSDTEKLDKVLPSMNRARSRNDANEKRDGGARISARNENASSKENEYLSPFRVQTSLQVITRHTRSTNDAKTRPRVDKGMLAKQEFPNSPIKKNRYKKRDREVANLSIDANFGPMPRGPRNRRLRCRNSAYANKKCCTTVLMHHSSTKRHKSTFKRKSKLTKVNRARERQAKDRYKVSDTLRASNKDVNDSMKRQKDFKASPGNNNDNSSRNYSYSGKNGGDGVKEGRKVTQNKVITTLDANDRGNVSTTTFDERNLRKKLARTAVPLSHRVARTSCLHHLHRNRASKQAEKKPDTMDATTQCRLIAENPPGIFVIGQLDDRRAVLRLDWPKYEELRLESETMVRDSRRSRVGQTARCFRHASAYAEDDTCCRKDTDVDSVQNGGSAFVPVDVFDSDLRIARLRSIGFKPIIKPLIRNDPEISESAFVSTSKVTKRDVAEEYDKYTSNEDNNVVVYMDDELQYQDIEEEEEKEEDDDDDDDEENDEDENADDDDDDDNDDDDDDDDEDEDEDDESALTRERRISLLPNVSTRSMLKGVQSRDDSNVLLPETLASRDNLESPWHGWKKIVTNNRSYWIGW